MQWAVASLSLPRGDVATSFRDPPYVRRDQRPNGGGPHYLQDLRVAPGFHGLEFCAYRVPDLASLASAYRCAISKSVWACVVSPGLASTTTCSISRAWAIASSRCVVSAFSPMLVTVTSPHLKAWHSALTAAFPNPGMNIMCEVCWPLVRGVFAPRAGFFPQGLLSTRWGGGHIRLGA